MDNNSNNTLFGFEAITDMFTENGANHVPVIDNEIDDEELERLQREGAAARKSVKEVFGDKATKTTVKEDAEEDEEIEEEEETVEEPKKKPVRSKSKTKEDEDEEEETDTVEKKNEGSEEDEDTESEEESSKVAALFDAIAEELEWEFDEDEEKPTTVEGLVDYFKNVIEENSTPQYASEEVAQLDEFVRNGGKLEDFYSLTPDIDLDNFDTTEEHNQKLIVRQLLMEKGYNEKQILRKIEKYEEAGILEDEAEDALESMKEISEKKKEKLLEQQRIEHEEAIERQQTFFNNVVGEIKAMDSVRGIKIPEKDKKALLTYIFKADASGKTQYQKDYSKSVKNLIESAYFTMKGDTLLDTAKKMGTSSAIRNLKQSLRSTGVSKSKKVNTTSTDSLFSKAVHNYF